MADSQADNAAVPAVSQASIPARVEGKFAPGVSGNPAGRPKGSRNDIANMKRQLEMAFIEHVTPEKLKRVINKVVERAEAGSIPAAKLIFDKLISNASDSEDAGDTGRTVVFQIVNATFAAQQALPQTPATDVEVVDVTPSAPIEQKQETNV